MNGLPKVIICIREPRKCLILIDHEARGSDFTAAIKVTTKFHNIYSNLWRILLVIYFLICRVDLVHINKALFLNDNIILKKTARVYQNGRRVRGGIRVVYDYDVK